MSESLNVTKLCYRGGFYECSADARQLQLVTTSEHRKWSMSFHKKSSTPVALLYVETTPLIRAVLDALGQPTKKPRVAIVPNRAALKKSERPFVGRAPRDLKEAHRRLQSAIYYVRKFSQ